MLTLESIIAATRQQAAFGELHSGPIPRDHAGPGRSRRPATTAPQPDETDVTTEYTRLLGKTERTEAEEIRYRELCEIMDRLPHPGMTDEQNRERIKAVARLDATLEGAAEEQISALGDVIARAAGGTSR